MESNFISANQAFCVNGNPDSNPRLGVPGSAKATVSLGVSQRSRGRGLRGSPRKSGAPATEQTPLRGNPQSGQQGREESCWSRFRTKAVYLQAVVRDNEIMESFDFLII